MAAALVFTYQGDIEDIIGDELKNGIRAKYEQPDDEEGFKAAWSMVQTQVGAFGLYGDVFMSTVAYFISLPLHWVPHP